LVAAVEKPSVEPAASSKAQLRLRSLWFAGLAFAALLVMLVGFNVTGLWKRLLGKPVAPRIQSIAVLPLENLTGDPAQEYFADGMTDALITDLARISSLRVVSRTSAMRYKGARKPLAELSQELNVDAIVEGSVVRSGNHVRISAQLIQAIPERHLWANAYERDLADIVTLQGEVARAVATEIGVRLTSQERERLLRSRRVNPEAYEAYLKGRHFFNRKNPIAFEKAVEYFQQAIRMDPSYAPAYSGLADSYVAIGFGAAPRMSVKEGGPKAKEAAMKALELDDTLAEAHTSLAFVRDRVESDFAGAEKEYSRAIELNPGYANAYLWYSQLLQRFGRHLEALEKARRGAQLEPASAVMQWNLGWQLLVVTRDYDQAIEHLHLAIELDPNLFVAHQGLGYALECKGMLKEALGEYQKALDLNPHAPQVKGTLGHLYAALGRRTEAEKILAELKERASDPNYAYLAAGTCIALGRKDEALELLERAYQGRSGWMGGLATEPYFDPLRSDPRFQDLLRRVQSDAKGVQRRPK
jgi:TolB-like protein/Tfp pilus assembly protein PilF